MTYSFGVRPFFMGQSRSGVEPFPSRLYMLCFDRPVAQ
jgi:hypothetical protein